MPRYFTNMADDSKLLLILDGIKSSRDKESNLKYHLLCQSLCGLIPLLDVSDEVLCSILIDTCIPALQNQTGASWNDNKNKSGSNNVVELLETIVHISKKSLFSCELLLWFINFNLVKVLKEVPNGRKIEIKQNDMKQFNENPRLDALYTKVKEWESLPLESHLTLLSALLKSEIEWNPVCLLLLRGIFNELLMMVFCEEESTMGFMKQAISTIPSFFRQTSLSKNSLVEAFWFCCEKITGDRDKQSRINKEIIIICTLMDDTPWEEYLCQLLNKNLFWNDIVFALSSDDCLTRKRALFVHKSVVAMCKRNLVIDIGEMECDSEEPLFVWCRSNQDQLLLSWEQIFLFLDTLEEKQPHIILPVLEQYSSLESSFINKSSKGGPQMHPMWLEAIFKRGLEHETKIVSDRMLDIVLTSNPLLFCQTTTHHGWDFIVDTLLPHLNSLRLYDTQSVSQNLPSIVPKLTHFISTYMSLLNAENKSFFISKFISALLKSTLSHVPMFYITYALSTITFTSTSSSNPSLLKELKTFVHSGLTNYSENIKNGTINNLLECLKMFCDRQRDLEMILDIVNILRKLPGFSITKTFGNLAQWVLGVDEKSNCIESISSDFVITYISNQMNECFNSKLDHDQYLSRILSFIKLFIQLPNEMKFDEENAINIWDSIFVPVEKVLARISSSPYIDSRHVEISLVFYCNLLEFSMKEQLCLDLRLKDFIINHLSNVLHYFFINILAPNSNDILLDRLDSFLLLPFDNHNIKEIFNEYEIVLNGIIRECIKILQSEKRIGFEGFKAFKILQWVCNLVSEVTYLRELQNTLMACLGEISLEVDYSQLTLQNDTNSNRDMTHFASDYIVVLWSCVKYYLETNAKQSRSSLSGLSSYSEEYICEKAVDCLDITPGEGLLPILGCLHVLLPKLDNISTLQNVLHGVWHLLHSFQRRSNFFGSVFIQCTQILFHGSVLKLCNDDIENEILSQWKWILDVGQEKRGILSHAIWQLTTEWKTLLATNKTLALQSMSNLLLILKDAVVFGPIHKRDAYITQNASTFAKFVISSNSLPLDAEISTAVFSTANRFNFNDIEDKSVRIQVLILLIELSEKGHISIPYSLIMGLIKVDLDIAKKKHRYYPDSLVHRTKIRTLQTILVVLHYFTNDQLHKLSEMIYAMLQTDNLPMIRHMNEWIIILILNHCPPLFASFWKRLLTADEKRLTNLAALTMIAYHTIKMMKGEEFENKSTKLLDFLLPWTQVQHVGIRMTAFVAMKGIWDEFVKRECDKLQDRYSVIQNCFVGDKHTSCAIRQRQQYIEDFFFSDFIPTHHVSLEVIFKTFLELSNVADTEVINVKEFGHLKLSIKCNCCSFGLYDSEPKLTASNVQSKVNSYQKGEKVGLSLDVQKKITPSKVIPPVDDPILRNMHIMKKINNPSLIVCASLIDRPANLGGLCRTCEILGASTFVIGSYHYVDDSNFKSLSVTSEKWMNIEQVMPRQLEEYVESMVKQGYTAVGLEQTAQSVKMQDYQFNKKTLLILGNEKEGIPVRIIQQLSTCIEIPQSGIIRSLNVHTSGAIAIWEYCKQML